MSRSIVRRATLYQPDLEELSDSIVLDSKEKKKKRRTKHKRNKYTKKRKHAVTTRRKTRRKTRRNKKMMMGGETVYRYGGVFTPYRMNGKDASLKVEAGILSIDYESNKGNPYGGEIKQVVEEDDGYRLRKVAGQDTVNDSFYIKKTELKKLPMSQTAKIKIEEMALEENQRAAAAEPEPAAASEPEPEPAAAAAGPSQTGRIMQMVRGAPAQSAAPEGTPQFSPQELDEFVKAINEGRATYLTDDQFFAAMVHKNKGKLDMIAYSFKADSRTFERLSNKSWKAMTKSRALIKKSMNKGNHEEAERRGIETIRHKEEYLTYLRWYSQLDAMAAKFTFLGGQVNVVNIMEIINGIMGDELKKLPTSRVEEGVQQFASQISDEDEMGKKLDATLKGAVTGEGEVDRLLEEISEELRLEAGK